MKTSYITLFKILASITPVCFILGALGILGDGDVSRTIAFVILPPIISISFLVLRKRLDDMGRVIGWINVAFLVYQVVMLSWAAVVMRHFN